MRIFIPVALTSLLGLATPVQASPEDGARAVLTAWSETYATRDHAAIANLYGPFARLRGMDVATHMGGAISEFFYFENLKAREQSVSGVRYDCQIFDDGVAESYKTGLCYGSYVLSQTLPSGELQVRPAHFSMALVQESSRWTIHDHVTTWVPAVVAECVTPLPSNKVGVASSNTGLVVTVPCQQDLKTGSISKPALVEPATAAVPAAQ